MRQLLHTYRPVFKEVGVAALVALALTAGLLFVSAWVE